MIVQEPGVTRLLASPAFRRSQLAAAAIAEDPRALQKLLHQVETHAFGVGRLKDTSSGVDVDIACAVVEAHIEELLEGAGSGPADRSCDEDAHHRLVVAALHYLVMDDDVIPDAGPLGHLDDVAILRWVTGVARANLSVR
ncbi:DUF1232 domain-containing protein [Leekyejoonella antrihumi]|uniref:DUF1232 domain-containing protein n=1 Tax=Leekyejoonella antrihumi TaxID=1660198 RepID=A0A563E5Q7_9MICO|nr:YkvA family protein [Leekyejoonella antrihumi]TWP37898.1 DUF1232 domain-containing protein [Leekyejoonella antrihumi]